MVKLYVEGGGDSAALRAACRQGFTQFIMGAGVKHKPRVVACGSRRDAYDSYCTAIANGEDAVLLVDSEAPVAALHQQGEDKTWQPWQHLKQRRGDGWEKPKDVQETDCHLMVQCMESWFIADPVTLKAFFGQGFQENQLHATANSVERVPKAQVYSVLANATKNCKTKARYGKGEHSFDLLGKIDPAKVTAASPWANRFVSLLKEKMKA